jgi:hypothetical protein
MHLRPDPTHPSLATVADTLDQPVDADESVLQLGGLSRVW